MDNMACHLSGSAGPRTLVYTSGMGWSIERNFAGCDDVLGIYPMVRNLAAVCAKHTVLTWVMVYEQAASQSVSCQTFSTPLRS
jgi:hypothetical protein